MNTKRKKKGGRRTPKEKKLKKNIEKQRERKEERKEKKLRLKGKGLTQNISQAPTLIQGGLKITRKGSNTEF